MRHVSFPRLPAIAQPFLTAVLLLLLTVGGRAGTTLTNYLRLAPAPASQQLPTEEEEEHRHATGKSIAVERRLGTRLSTSGDAIASVPVYSATSPYTSLTARMLPDREADLRGGLGAPRRC